MQKIILNKITSAYNTENYQLATLFGRAKHLKVSVIPFKRVKKFFTQKVGPKFFLPRMKKKMIRFYYSSFHILLLKQT